MRHTTFVVYVLSCLYKYLFSGVDQMDYYQIFFQLFCYPWTSRSFVLLATPDISQVAPWGMFFYCRIVFRCWGFCSRSTILGLISCDYASPTNYSRGGWWSAILYQEATHLTFWTRSNINGGFDVYTTRQWRWWYCMI